MSRFRRILSVVARLLLVATLWFLGLGTYIAFYGEQRDPQPADAAIVLGAAVWTNRPSPVFKERILHAVELHRTGQVPVLIFTGGRAQGDKISESIAGRDLALAEGVPSAALRTESVSTVTWENLIEARRICQSEGLSRVLLVSDPPHMRRAVLMARDLGMDAYPAPTPTSRYISARSRGPFLAREAWFFTAYLVERTIR